MALSFNVQLTQGNVGGLGRTLTEDVWQQIFAVLASSPYAGWIISGYDDGGASGLTQTVNTGVAVINGLRVSDDGGTEDITLTDDATNYIWLEVTESSGNVNDAQLVKNTSGTAPSATLSILLLKIVTSSGTVSSTIEAGDSTAFGVSIHDDTRNDLVKRDGTRPFTAAQTFDAGFTSAGAAASFSANFPTGPGGAPSADAELADKKYVDDTTKNPTKIRKASDETVSSSTTLQSDDDFTFSVATNSDYVVELFLKVFIDVNADWKFQWSLPASATCDGFYITAPSGVSDGFDETSSETFNLGGSDADVFFHMILLISTAGTSGTAVLQWAQAVSDANGCIVRGPESWMTHQICQ